MKIKNEILTVSIFIVISVIKLSACTVLSNKEFKIHVKIYDMLSKLQVHITDMCTFSDWTMKCPTSLLSLNANK